jgi:hypothetical protein
MPDLGTRGIVSASGYTRPAIRKAAKHGIILFELAPLADSGTAFEHFRVNEMPLVRSGLEWASVDEICINPQRKATAVERDGTGKNPSVEFDGRVDEAWPDLSRYLGQVRLKILDDLMKDWPVAEQVVGLWKQVSVTLRIEPPQAVAVLAGGPMPIEAVRVRGKVRWREEKSVCPMIVLRRVGSEKPEAGCCAFEMAGWGLCGLVVSNINRDIRFMRITTTDRNKKKVYRQVLRHVAKAGEPLRLLG